MADVAEIRLQGFKELSDKLSNLEESVKNWTAPLTEAGKVFTKFYGTVPFASRGNVYGTTWRPLSKPYETLKADKWGGGKPVLIASGKMSTSFTYKVTKYQVSIYNTSELFPHHQFGTDRGLPARVMMKLDDQRRKLAINTLREELLKKVDKA